MKDWKARATAGVAFFTGAIWLVSWMDSPLTAQAPKASVGKVPIFQVDPSWPKIPSQWILGEVSSVSVDAQNRIWVLHRPHTLRPEQKAMTAPPVLVFDEAGNFIKAWGGPGEGYDWPATEHGIFVDYKGYVWIGGSEPKLDHQLLKFTQDGKFVLQIGRKGQSKGNKDTGNLNQPADAFVYPKTNELFVADGYGNRRVIVFDADTGAFKRMWGAFGNQPTDPEPPVACQPQATCPPPVSRLEGPGSPQFVLVHSARISDDGLVYVTDKDEKRVQVFTIDGKFQKQVFIARDCQPPGCGNGATAASTAFSRDRAQQFLYVASRSDAHAYVLDRKTLEILYSFGKPGTEPGSFNIIHEMETDLKGNLYTTEVCTTANLALGKCSRRVQKFVYKGMSSLPKD